jgi:polysaccharide pyruvyl transferase WcaK-like protein
VAVLQQLATGRRDCEFYFLDSTNSGSKPYRGLGGFIGGANVRRHQFSSPESDLEFLASLDLLVSSRLHTPLVALQFGVPVLSLLAEGKTTLLFENLGLGHLCFGRRGILELYRLLKSRKSLDGFLRDFRFPDIQRLRAEAAGHMRFLCERMG